MSESTGAPAVGLLDTLRELVLEARTGTLSINTAVGAAEIRLAAGAIEDAVFLRAEGEKALYRLLAQADASSHFVSGAATGMRRIRTPTDRILTMAPAIMAATAEARRAFPAAHERPLLATEAESDKRALSTAGRALLVHLRAPVLIDDLLDRVPAGDLEILSAVRELQEAGCVRTLASPNERVPLGTPEQVDKLLDLLGPRAALAIGPRVRLVFAGSIHRLAVIAHSSLCLEGASPPPQGTPSLPMPHPVARVPLSSRAEPEREAIELEVVACPLVPAYAPLWPMALSGAFAVVRIDDAAGTLLEQACEGIDVRILDADMLVGPYDETNVAEVAMLVRAAFDGAA